MKLLLINPPFNRPMGLEQDYIHIGLSGLASYVEKYTPFQARVYNGEIDPTLHFIGNTGRGEVYDKYLEFLDDENHPIWQEIERTLKTEVPDVVGINAIAVKYKAVLKIARLVKEKYSRDCAVVVGGQYATVRPQRFQNTPNIDHVVAGEGELSLVHLLLELDAGRQPPVMVSAKGFIEDLDTLPFPGRHLLLNGHSPNGYGHMVTNRGCPFRCGFCDSSSVWQRQVRYRSVDNVLREIREVREIHGTELFSIWDESFTLLKERTLDFCRRLGGDISWKCDTRVNLLDEEIIAALKASGCTHLTVGIESGSPSVLKFIRKAITLQQIRRAADLLNKYGMIWKANFMVGFPVETEADIKASMDLIDRIQPSRVTLSYFTPYPGTELFEYCLAHNLIPKDYDPELYSHQSPHNLFNDSIPRERLLELYHEFSAKVDAYNEARGGVAVWSS